MNPCLSTDSFDDDYSSNSRVLDYSRQFIDKVINYRIGKMYGNYTIPVLPVYNEFLSASEDEDITQDELWNLLDEFVVDYNSDVKQKKKSDDKQ